MTEQPRGQAEALLLHYWYILRKRYNVVAAFAVLMLVSVGIATSLSTPYYASEAVVEIAPKAPTFFEVNEVAEVVSAGSSQELRTYYATQYKIMQSRTIMERSVVRLKELTPEELQAAGVDAERIDDFDDKKKPWRHLTQHMSLQPVVETNLVKVVVEYPDPDKAALFANVIAQTYMDRNVQHAARSTEEALTFLEEQVQRYRKRKLESEGKAQEFRFTNDLLGLTEQYNTTSEALSKLQQAWSGAHTERIEIEAVYIEMESLSRGGDWKSLATHLSTDNSGLRDLLARHQTLEQERTRLGARYKARHPEMVRVETEAEGVAKQIRQQVDGIVGSKQAALKVVSQREQALQRELDAIKSDVENLDSRLLELRLLEDDAKRNDLFYQSLATRLTEVDLSQVRQANNIQFVDPAIRTDKPVRPNLPVNLAMAVVFGLFGGCAMAFFMEYLDQTVKGVDDIERIVGVPFLGVVPIIPAEDRKAVANDVDREVFVHARPRHHVAESLRSIRTNVLFRTPQRKFRTLLITSAVPQEGKSFVSSNLSAMIAMTGSRTLLIDADLRLPSLHKRFGLSSDVGLSSVLTGECSLKDAIQHTHVTGLDVVVAGPRPPNPGELLGGGRMQRIINSVRDYDMVVVDSPPVRNVADPLVLSSVVDGVVLVVLANQTKRSLVQQSCAQLREMNANIIGAVVNKLDLKRAGYGYYYYYDYGYYYGDPDQEPGRKSG